MGNPEQLTEQAQQRKWGLYRNTGFQMAEILRKESKIALALETYLEVCYLDLNGPNNAGGYQGARDFDPARGAFLAPDVISRMRKAGKKLKLSADQLQEISIAHNQPIRERLRLPLSPEECWDKIAQRLLKDS